MPKKKIPTPPLAPVPNQKEIQKKLEKLSYICQQFDPYNPTTLTQDVCQLLEEFHLDPKGPDPFHLTNHLLLLIDQFSNQLSPPKENEL